jgi:hypothetical protein
MSRKYKFHNKSGLYFVSFATVNWIDVFTRQAYFNVLADNVNYCRKAKGMELYCYCFMTSQACPERSRSVLVELIRKKAICNANGFFSFASFIHRS